MLRATDLDEEAGCDACSLGGRRSHIAGTFLGDPYDSDTFEAVDDSDSDSDDPVFNCESLSSIRRVRSRRGRKADKRR